MRLLDRFRYNPTIVPATGAQTVLLSTYNEGGYERLLPQFESFANVGYANNGIVFSVILARLMLFSEAEFKFRDLTTKRLYGTPALGKLETPWPGGTTGELLARMEQDASLAGNAFIRDAGDRLERLRPDRVSIIFGQRMDGMLEPVGYGYDRDGIGDPLAEAYTIDEVAHWTPIPDPMAISRGMSWLTPVLREIDADLAMTTHKGKFFENAATPNLMIRYQKKLTKEQVTDLRERWDGRFAGASNAYKTAIIDEGADVTVVGQSFEQMAFTAVQAAGENRIAAAAGVPGIVVGLKEGLQAATYSNYEQAMRRFADVTMRPNWRSAAACLAKLVDVPAGSRLWYDTTDISALRQGEKDRAETAQIMALAAGELIRSGYDPASVGPALTAGDFGLLSHTGAIPTALYPAGKAPQPGGTA